MRSKFLVLACGVALAAPARAVETAAFLNLGVGARYLAMGGAGTAISDDANSLYWNPAGLAAAQREFSVSDMELQQSTRLDFAALALPTAKLGTFAVGGAYLSQGTIDGRDLNGKPTGGFSASDANVTIAHAYRTNLVDVGGGVKFVQSHIGAAQATTFALDLGMRKQWEHVVLAATLRNLGPGMKYVSETDDLPMRLGLGAAYKFEHGHALTVELINAPRAGGTDVGFGGEFQAMKNVFVRGGYTTQTAITGGSGFDAARGLTLGVGFHANVWTIDYAAVPMGELGSTHRFTLSARW